MHAERRRRRRAARRPARGVVAALDPVPQHVIEAAEAALDWRTIDDELAELLHDSSAEPALAGVRAEASTRVLSFAGERVRDRGRGRRQRARSDARRPARPARCARRSRSATETAWSTVTADAARPLQRRGRAGRDRSACAAGSTRRGTLEHWPRRGCRSDGGCTGSRPVSGRARGRGLPRRRRRPGARARARDGGAQRRDGPRPHGGGVRRAPCARAWRRSSSTTRRRRSRHFERAVDAGRKVGRQREAEARMSLAFALVGQGSTRRGAAPGRPRDARDRRRRPRRAAPAARDDPRAAGAARRGARRLQARAGELPPQRRSQRRGARAVRPRRAPDLPRRAGGGGGRPAPVRRALRAARPRRDGGRRAAEPRLRRRPARRRARSRSSSTSAPS